jgi:hypothetical protein
MEEKIMRTRMITAAVVLLGLGIAGITLAQQPGAEPKPQAADKAALRAQVVKLRVEIELLQLDHDADRESILGWMKGERMGPGGLAGMAIETMLGMMGNAEATKTIEEGEKLVAKAKDRGEDEEAVGRRVLAEAVKKQLEPMKKNYAKQAAELAEKRLELDAVEKQYFRD